VPIIRFKANPTITAGAYSANDVIGGRMQFPGLTVGTLQAITITDAASQHVAYNLFLFESQPTNISDNAALDIADADLPKIIYDDAFATTTRQAFNSNSMHRLYNLDVPLWATGDSVWGFLSTTGTPTYAATSDITVILQVETNSLRVGLSS